VSEAVVKIHNNFFSIFGSRVKNAFQTISRTLAILAMETAPADEYA